MAAGLVLIVLFGAFLLIGMPLLIRVLMKFFWKIQDKKEYLKNKTPYYKDPLLFLTTIVLSLVILGYLFYLLLILFDRLYPNWGLTT